MSTRAVAGLVIVSLALALSGARRAHAHGADAAEGTGRSRASWAALLAGYLVVGAATTAGAYVLRDNFFGRGVASGAAGWGGFSVGAGLGYGLVGLGGCDSEDCSARQDVATALGGLLGAAVGTTAGFWLARTRGMSRPYVTGAAMAPFAVFLVAGTVASW
jgi:hypothetical protein